MSISLRCVAVLSVLVAASVASCHHEQPAPDAAPPKTWKSCQGGDQAFVRRALFALDGRRPWGQAEVNAYEDLLHGARVAGQDENDARRAVATIMMADPAYRLRWADFLMDTLHVLRAPFVRTDKWELAAPANCFGPLAVDGGPNLAAWVRDNDPLATNPPQQYFSMADLLQSSLSLDDLSPLYRASLFQMLNVPLPAANLDDTAREMARRGDFGTTFSNVYLHRNVTCLPCHNSEASVIHSPDPTLNRAWMLPGHLEKAVFGTSTAADDPLVYFSVFRYGGVAGGTEAPWGWNADRCGRFDQPQQFDPLAVNAHFASLGNSQDHPQGGLTASVWGVERALHRGVDLLATKGLPLDENQDVTNPDAAFAYLVAANVSESVWAEIIGSRLTTANYFARTEAQRDILRDLTDTFLRSHFSLKTLLLAIVTRPEFNLAPPNDSCWESAYPVPRVFDPWSNGSDDPAMRQNSSADAVFAISPRPLRRSLHGAMGWPYVADFPVSEDDVKMDAELGVYLQSDQPGFRGLDLQAKLRWESVYGRCARRGANDFIDGLVARATASGATVEQAIVALKDRLIGEPGIDDAERAALEGLLGGSLSSTDLSQLDPRLRLACGAYVSSAQFLLGGSVPADTRVVPVLAPDDHTYALVCQDVAARAAETRYAVSCGVPLTVGLR